MDDLLAYLRSLPEDELIDFYQHVRQANNSLGTIYLRTRHRNAEWARQVKACQESLYSFYLFVDAMEYTDIFATGKFFGIEQEDSGEQQDDDLEY